MIANVIIAHWNKPNEIIDKCIKCFSDWENARFIVVNNKSSVQTMGLLVKNLTAFRKQAEAEGKQFTWNLFERPNIGMDHAAYLFGLEMAKKYNMESDITWFMQESNRDHMIDMISSRGWYREDSIYKINLKFCKIVLEESPNIFLGAGISTEDNRFGHTLWLPRPGRYIGRDIDKENKSIVDHNYWCDRFGLDKEKVHCAGGYICLQTKRANEMFLENISLTDKEIYRPGFAWEAERWMTYQLPSEKYNMKFVPYFDIDRNTNSFEPYMRSVFSYYFIDQYYRQGFPIMSTPEFNKLIYKLYGYTESKLEINKQWDDDKILKYIEKEVR